MVKLYEREQIKRQQKEEEKKQKQVLKVQKAGNKRADELLKDMKNNLQFPAELYTRGQESKSFTASENGEIFNIVLKKLQSLGYRCEIQGYYIIVNLPQVNDQTAADNQELQTPQIESAPNQNERKPNLSINTRTAAPGCIFL